MADVVEAVVLLLIGIAWGMGTRRGRASLSSRVRSAKELLRRTLGRPMQPTWRHPCFRLAGLALLTLTAGWVGVLFTHGASGLPLSSQMQPSSAHAKVCHRMQSEIHAHASYKARIGLLVLKPGTVVDTPGARCPYGGVIRIDEEGFLTCSRHGPNPSLEALIPVSKGGP